MDPDILDSPFTQADEFVVAFLTIDGLFSNWSAHQIDVWGQRFVTVEHAYHYQKFVGHDTKWAEKVRGAKSPWIAKRLARERDAVLPGWMERRRSVMRELLSAKVTQHDDVRSALRWTGMRVIIEKGNPNEEYWGDGRNHAGQNVLGKLWMELRGELFTPAELSGQSPDG
jgi:ribA/ribD-fused uncharacterized protein